MIIEKITKNLSKNHKTFQEFLYDNRVYGFSMAVIEDLNIAETLTIGLKQNITENTLFQAASMSKSIFAATMMKLQETGLIDLDRNLIKDIQKIIPLNKLEKEFRITYKDLLNHTSGFDVHGFSGYQRNQDLPSVLEIVQGERPSNSLKMNLIRQPRTTFSYSGGGYMLAQYLMETETKRVYESWVEELVFKPINMKHSFLANSKNIFDESTIAIAWSAFDTPIEKGYIVYPELAAAGLWSTPTDLSLFGIEMIKALHGNSSWLMKESAESMLTLPESIRTEYGLGFHIPAGQNKLMFGHGGDNIGYHGRMLFCSTTQSGVVVMVNSEIGEEVPNKIVDMIIREYM